MIQKYNDFKITFLLESILEITKPFEMLLYTIQHPYAKFLQEIIDSNKDIKTNFNALNISHRKDKINFIPDSQFQRPTTGSKFDRKESEADIGRLVRSILISAGYNVVDAELENFVDLYKTSWEQEFGQELEFDIVQGEDIKFWYLYSNYEGGGTLGNSCMRYSNCQDYLDIYEENEDVCSLVILTKDDKLLARALLWQLDSGDLFLDRIYYTEKSRENLLKLWVKSKFSNKKILFYPEIDVELKVTLKKYMFEWYPYMDSLLYLIIKQDENAPKAYLCNIDIKLQSYLNKEPVDTSLVSLKLRSTEGMYECISHNYSKRYDKFLTRSESLYSNDLDDYLYLSDFVQSIILGDWILKDVAVYSKAVDDYIYKERSINHPKFGYIMKNWLMLHLTPLKSETTLDALNNFETLLNTLGKYSVKGLEKSFKVDEILVLPDEDKYHTCNKFDIKFAYDYGQAVRTDTGLLPRFISIKMVKVDKFPKEHQSLTIRIPNYSSDEFFMLEEMAKSLKLNGRLLYVDISEIVKYIKPELWLKANDLFETMGSTSEVISVLAKLHELALEQSIDYRSIFEIFKNKSNFSRLDLVIEPTEEYINSKSYERLLSYMVVEFVKENDSSLSTEQVKTEVDKLILITPEILKTLILASLFRIPRQNFISLIVNKLGEYFKSDNYCRDFLDLISELIDQEDSKILDIFSSFFNQEFPSYLRLKQFLNWIRPDAVVLDKEIEKILNSAKDKLQ